MKNKKYQGYAYIPLDDTANYFYSADLGLVAYLLCRNYELVGTDNAMGNKILFIIKKKKGIEKDSNDYWDSDTKIDAQSYFNQLKRLKNQIHSQR